MAVNPNQAQGEGHSANQNNLRALPKYDPIPCGNSGAIFVHRGFITDPRILFFVALWNMDQWFHRHVSGYGDHGWLFKNAAGRAVELITLDEKIFSSPTISNSTKFSGTNKLAIFRVKT